MKSGQTNNPFKRYLKMIIIFLMPVILFLTYTEVRIRGYSNMYDQKKYNIEKILDKIEILILGNSQAVSGIDPGTFTATTFNFAHDSQSLYYDLQITEKYLPQMKNLKVVVIPISYFTMHYILERSTGSPRQYNYYFSYHIPLIKEKPFDLRKFSYIAAYSPRIAFGIVYLNKFKSAPQRDDGYAPRKGTLPPDNRAITAYGLMARHTELIKNGDYCLNKKYLNRFVAVLKKKNIDVVFTTLPVSKSYSQLQEKKILEQNRKAIMELEKKYGVKYVDIASYLKLDNRYFSDIDHLNEEGAAIVSAKLDSAIQQHHHLK